MGSHRQPRVLSIKWGEIAVEDSSGKKTNCKDARLLPGSVENWIWHPNTNHDPGIAKEEVELFVGKVDVVVLSRGMDQKLKVQQDTVDLLRRQGIEVVNVQTEEAVKMYQQFVDRGSRVGALLHSTC